MDMLTSADMEGLLKELRMKVLGEDGTGSLDSHFFPSEATPGAWLVCRCMLVLGTVVHGAIFETERFLDRSLHNLLAAP